MINANNARILSNEWNWKDTLQENCITRKIKRQCKIGNRELILTITPRPRVVEKFKREGYNVIMGYVLGAIIKW